MCHWNFSLL